MFCVVTDSDHAVGLDNLAPSRPAAGRSPGNLAASAQAAGLTSLVTPPGPAVGPVAMDKPYDKLNGRPRATTAGVPRLLLLVDMAVAAGLFFGTGARDEAAFLADDARDMARDWDVALLDLLILAALRVLVQFAAWSKLSGMARRVAADPSTAPAAGRTAGRLRLWALSLAPLVSAAYCIAKLTLFETSAMERLRRGDALAYALAQALVGTSVAFSAAEAVLGVNARTRFVRMCGLQARAFSLNGAGDEEEAGKVNEDGTKKTGNANLKRLLQVGMPERWLILGGLVALGGSSASTIAAPLFFGKVIDAAVSPHDAKQLLGHQVLVLGGIYLGGAVCSFVRSWLFTWAGQRLVARVRCQLLGGIIKQELAFFDVTRTGELTNRLSSDTQVIQNAMTVNISMLARYLVQIVGSLAVMFGLSWKLTLVLLSVVPPVAIGAVWYGKKVKKLRKKFQDELAAASSVAEETLSNMRTVRSFANEEHSKAMYSSAVDKSYRVGYRLALVQAVFSGTTGAVASLAVLLVLWYGGTLVVSQALTPGLLSGFMRTWDRPAAAHVPCALSCGPP